MKANIEKIIDEVFYNNGKIDNHLSLVRTFEYMQPFKVSDEHFKKMCEVIEHKESITTNGLSPLEYLRLIETTTVEKVGGAVRFKILEKSVKKAFDISTDILVEAMNSKREQQAIREREFNEMQATKAKEATTEETPKTEE